MSHIPVLHKHPQASWSPRGFVEPVVKPRNRRKTLFPRLLVRNLRTRLRYHSPAYLVKKAASVRHILETLYSPSRDLRASRQTAPQSVRLTPTVGRRRAGARAQGGGTAGTWDIPISCAGVRAQCRWSVPVALHDDADRTRSRGKLEMPRAPGFNFSICCWRRIRAPRCIAERQMPKEAANREPLLIGRARSLCPRRLEFDCGN